MLGWLEGIFEWLGDILRPLLQGIVDNLRRFKWFVVSFIAAIVAPIKWIFDWLASAAAFAAAETARMFTSVQAMQVTDAPVWWSGLATASSLANCIVPLDYALAMGTLLLSVYIGLGLIRGIVWVYKRLPRIHGWGSN